ncbi:uncharacterized protein [Anolis sagrei]|uniref:uncharacterized protein n=1 Tax=Anolis sagrei TaxID=38937 RepID=UPI0035225740
MDSPAGPSTSASLSVPDAPRKKQSTMKRIAESEYRYWSYPITEGATGFSIPGTPMSSPKKRRESSSAKPPTRLNLLPGLYDMKNKFTDVEPDFYDRGTARVELKKLFPEMPRMRCGDADVGVNDEGYGSLTNNLGYLVEEIVPDTDPEDLRRWHAKMEEKRRVEAEAEKMDVDDGMDCKADYKDTKSMCEGPNPARSIRRSLLSELMKDEAEEKENMSVDENTSDGFESSKGSIHLSDDVRNRQIGDSQTKEVSIMSWL